MNKKECSLLEKLKEQATQYIVKKKDKELFIESAVLIFIYSISFLILSMGRVQQTFLGMSEFAFSSIQMMMLTFIFAIVITLVIYSIYKRAKELK